MHRGREEQRWLWVTLMLSCISIVALVFAAWEVVENRYFRHVDYVTLHYLYITRGVASSLLLAFWAAWYVIAQRRHSEEQLRRSRERYRSLLEVSPGAVALYDGSLQVSEWNATAERLYRFSKAEVLGKPLPTVPAGREQELRGLLDQVRSGTSLLSVETLRCDKHGSAFEVQLSLLPFREGATQNLFLEVTEDIRERVRLRERLVELEKLTTMGRMAAGTAHHLNTPLAAMLLRVQMMRERAGQDRAADLERLESGIMFCKQFVDRLLQFGRRPVLRKQPEEIGPLIRGVVSFLAPAIEAKRARVSIEPDSTAGDRVLADRNLLEALFSALLTNSLDAITNDGRIAIRCQKSPPDCIEIHISDDGHGIPETDLARVFEPFFTTKGPGGGTGLGLSISRNIVLEHGGSLWLHSAAGEGTTAIVKLPCCEARPAIEQVSL